MTRTSLDDARWMSLRLAIERIPHAWKRDEVGLRRFVEAVLWILRTGAPWRDLAHDLGHWPSVYHRFRRWSLRGWWTLLFEHLRPVLPDDGLVLVDSTTCKAHRAASGAARSTAAAESLGRRRIAGSLARRDLLQDPRLHGWPQPDIAADRQPRKPFRSALCQRPDRRYSGP